MKTTSFQLFNYLFSAFLLAGLFGCGSNSTRDTRDYYFPFRQLTEGQVYEYRPVDSNVDSEPEYWYYRSILLDTAMYLAVNFYNEAFQPERFSREELVDGGIILNQLFLYEMDSTGRHQRVEAAIESGNIFPFRIDPTDPQIYLYRVRFRLPSQPVSASTTLIINRQFARDTTVAIDSESVPALLFDLRGVVEIRDTVAGGLEPTFSGGEIYARGIGLVEYWRTVGDRRSHYRLADRYSMQEFEAKAAEMLVR